jgi:cell wall-associated NlpC family hydrolase
MPLVDALARVQQIQATLTRFQPATSVAARGTAAATASSTASVTSTATAFDAVLATTVDGSASGVQASTTPSASAATTGTPADGVSGSDIVEAAKKYIGVPYVFGGEDATGMDCSGLVQRVLADLGVEAPRVVSTQQNMGVAVPSLAEAQPGDLIVTHNADHIVIYAGDGQIIHAPYAGRDVSLQKNYLTDADIQTIRRVTVEPAVTAAATPNDVSAAVASLMGTASTGSATTTADLIAAAQMSLFSGRTS